MKKKSKKENVSQKLKDEKTADRIRGDPKPLAQKYKNKDRSSGSAKELAKELGANQNDGSHEPISALIRIPLKKIKPNPHNCNVMDQAEIDAIISDMKNMKDPSELGPIRIRVTALGGEEYEIIDGEHRWMAAKKAGWKDILTIIYSMTAQEAMLWNFKINRQRGSHDPMKEARFFQHLTETGMSQKEVAEMLNVDRSVVSKRISILKIDPEVLKRPKKEPPIPVSILEVVAQVEDDKKVQKEMIRDYLRYDYSVERLEGELRDHKKKVAKEKAFQELLKTAKHPNCPKCNHRAVRKHYWRDNALLCPNGHSWFHKSGKDPDQVREKTASKPAQKQAPVTTGFRSTYSLDEVVKATRKALKPAIANMLSTANKVKISPKRNMDYGEDCSLEADSVRCHITLRSDQGNLTITAEKKDYKKYDDKIRVDTGYGSGGVKKNEKLFGMLMRGELTFDKLKPQKEKKSKKTGGRKNA